MRGNVKEFLDKPEIQILWKRAQSNPHLALASTLFAAGVIAGVCGLSTFAGALFGAGASLLGAGVTEFNVRRSKEQEKLRKQADARRYFSPELKRVVERVLYIHQRACPNFISASVDSGTKPNDLKEDFIPEHPVLYPNVPAFGDLPPGDANSLIDFYDSLNELEYHVQNWWEREGQLPVNVFLSLLHVASRSLNLALICLDRFEIDKNFPPPYESWGTLASRLEQSLAFAEQARAAHMKRAEEKTLKYAPPYSGKPKS
jgi:hypothetical protein